MPIFVREHDIGSHTKIINCEMAARFTPNHEHSKRYRFMVTFQSFSQATVTSSAAEICSPIFVIITNLAMKAKLISSFMKW